MWDRRIGDLSVEMSAASKSFRLLMATMLGSAALRSSKRRRRTPKKSGRFAAECKHLILQQLRPGASCRAIYDAFIAKLTTKNLPPISFVGHGIGLFLHEDPYLGRTPVIGSTEDALLEAGMVLGFEPLCYRTGYGFGMQNKDMVAVTEDGSNCCPPMPTPITC